jgi:hypothetical protein
MAPRIQSVETESGPAPEQVEEHWAHIIAAVRGSQMAAVWYEYQRERLRQKDAICPPACAPVSMSETKSK